MMRTSWIAAVFLFAAGCSGRLVVENPDDVTTSCEDSSVCGVGRVCDPVTATCVPSTATCSPTALSGDCPAGRLCDNATCVCSDPETCGCADGDCTTNTPYCDCAASEGCTSDGTCVEVTTGNECRDGRPDGLCVGGEVCVGGHCVPLDNSNSCAPSRPQGLCPSGQACDRGYCVPADDNACSSDAPAGTCDSGRVCVDGDCDVVACSSSHPFGACGDEQRCVNGACQALPCGELHPNGACSDGQYCASTRECIPDAQCGTGEDCAATEICSLVPSDVSGEVPVCIVEDSCRFDDDCEVAQAADYGQGYECAAGACVPRQMCSTGDDCIPGDFCSLGGMCRAPGACDQDGDCSTGNYCSTAVNLCTPDGECRADEDCDGTDECSLVATNPTCIAPGTCLGDADCGPGFTCNTGVSPTACEQTGATCVDNDPEASCSGSVTICYECPEGQRCSVSDGVCIDIGNCRENADCASGYICENFNCAEITECNESSDCQSGEVCTQNGACVPSGLCATDADCLDDETCGPEFKCIPKQEPGCGFNDFVLGSALPPNILVTIDRSASMQLCGPGQPLDGECGNAGDDCNCCSNDPSGAPACGELGCTEQTVCVVQQPPGFCSGDGTTVCNNDGDCSGVGGTCGDYFGGRFPTCSGGVCSEVCSEDESTPCVSDGDCTGTCIEGQSAVSATRWEQARDAVNTVIAEQGTAVAFGLSRYPEVGAGDSCDLACNWTSCNNLGGLNGGSVDVPVAVGTGSTIASTLAATYPGGATPSAPTLRTIADSGNLGGLSALDRANSILLVTDGEATGDTADIRVCEPQCSDSTKNGTETDVDCGGMCPACAEGSACEGNFDCAGSSVCTDGLCRPATCFDEAQNGDETDVDCGGACPACVDDAACSVAGDCVSGICTGSVCVAAACEDGIKNGSETDVDCGGTCATDCIDGANCESDDDCASNVCQAGTCRVASCGNSTQDVNETDTDCGGSDCGPCTNSSSCSGNGDCTSGFCDSTICEAPGCANGTMDGDETDVDCGGSCEPCTAGNYCDGDSDCEGSCRVCGGFCDNDGSFCNVDNDCGGTCSGGTMSGAGCASDSDCPDDGANLGTCDYFSCNANDSSADGCRVDAALDKLYSTEQQIRGFVVGFSFSGVNPELNCYAAHGRTGTLVSGCETLTTDNCDTFPQACYFTANNSAELISAFDVVVDEVTSCIYDVGSTRPPTADPEGLNVYLDFDTGGGRDLQFVPRSSGWTYRGGTDSIEFLGGFCDELLSGNAVPLVVYQCPAIGGG